MNQQTNNKQTTIKLDGVFTFINDLRCKCNICNVEIDNFESTKKRHISKKKHITKLNDLQNATDIKDITIHYENNESDDDNDNNKYNELINLVKLQNDKIDKLTNKVDELEEYIKNIDEINIIKNERYDVNNNIDINKIKENIKCNDEDYETDETEFINYNDDDDVSDIEESEDEEENTNEIDYNKLCEKVNKDNTKSFEEFCIFKNYFEKENRGYDINKLIYILKRLPLKQANCYTKFITFYKMLYIDDKKDKETKKYIENNREYLIDDFNNTINNVRIHIFKKQF